MLQQMLPEREVICVLIAASIRILPAAAQEAGLCLYVSNYVDHNFGGLHWLLECVWPLIVARDPWAQPLLCGVCRSGSRRYDRVELLGAVENLEDIWRYGAIEIDLKDRRLAFRKRAPQAGL